MSKLAIVLCFVLFASTSTAYSWTDSLKAIQQNVQQVTDSVITKVEEELIATQLKSVSEAAELSNKTRSFGWKINEEIQVVAYNLANEITKFATKAEGVNIDECASLSENAILANAAMALMSITEKCINNKVDSGLVYIDAINKIANEVLTELTEIGDKAKHCGDNLNDAKSIFEAISCSKSNATDATWASIKAASKLTIEKTKLKFVMVTIEPSLSYCIKNEYDTLYRESRNIVSRVKECIQQKIDNPEPADPKVHQNKEQDKSTAEFSIESAK